MKQEKIKIYTCSSAYVDNGNSLPGKAARNFQRHGSAAEKG